MSRAAQRNGAVAPRRPNEEGGELHAHLHTLRLSSPSSKAPADTLSPDICPVCKSSRYLNPNMRFLVNPECYHKMCESCVDRIFSQGPAPCPVAGCERTLRKQRFRRQTFEDIQVEKEVDVRRRVAQTYVYRSYSLNVKRSFVDNELQDSTAAKTNSTRYSTTTTTSKKSRR